MPVYTPPENDTERIAFLQRAAETAVSDQADGRSTLDAPTLAQLSDLIPAFQAARTDVDAKLSVRAQETAESQQAFTNLQTHVRHLQAVVQMRVQRRNEPAAVLSYYGMYLDGTTPPRPTAQDGWLQLAQQVIDGDGTAVAAGHDAAINPSAAELQTALEQAQKETADTAPADAAYQQAQQTLASHRQQADSLIADIMAQLRFHNRHQDPAALRRILRRYGAQYRYLPGEPPEEEVESGE